MKKRKLYFRHKKTKEINRGTEKGDTHTHAVQKGLFVRAHSACSQEPSQFRTGDVLETK